MPRSADEAKRVAAEAADKLLANPVIESYRIEVDAAQRRWFDEFASSSFPAPTAITTRTTRPSTCSASRPS